MRVRAILKVTFTVRVRFRVQAARFYALLRTAATGVRLQIFFSDRSDVRVRVRI